MAKGDKKKQQKAVDTAVTASQGGLDQYKNEIIPQLKQDQGYYTRASDESFGDYRDIMNQYKAMAAEGVDKNKPGLERVNYNRSPEMNEAFGGYRNFMQTGGYSPEDIRDMRARGVSPIRANYANALNEMERQKNLSGGYSPNAGALRARMASSQGQQMADAVQNVNAGLAEQVQKGKMFGTEGMGGLSVHDTGFAQQAALANQRAGIDIARDNLNDPRMNAIHGQAQLFGTTPGMARMFGDQVQQGIGNMGNAAGMQQNVGQQRIGGQQIVSQTPSNFEVGMGRVGQGINMAGQVAGAWMGLPGNLPGMAGNASQVYTDPNILRQHSNIPRPPGYR
jgi:hypothetical protein